MFTARARVARGPLEGNILIARDDGSHARAIAYGYAPSVSPDGRSVAYFQENPNGGSLRIVSTRGGRSRMLLRSSGPTGLGDGPPLAWSPDSRRLVASGGGGAAIIDLATGRRTVLPDFDLAGASFSPDGSRIVLGDSGLRSESLSVVRADGTGARTFVRSGSFAFWGRPGILYSSSGIQLVPYPGARPRHVYSNGHGEVEAVNVSGDGQTFLARIRFGAPLVYQPLLLRPGRHSVKLLAAKLTEPDALSRDGRLVLGEMDDNVVTVDLAGHVRTLATGARYPSWTR